MTDFFGKPVEVSIQHSGSYDAEVVPAGSGDKTTDDQTKTIDKNLSYEIDGKVKLEDTDER